MQKQHKQENLISPIKNKEILFSKVVICQLFFRSLSFLAGCYLGHALRRVPVLGGQLGKVLDQVGPDLGLHHQVYGALGPRPQPVLPRRRDGPKSTRKVFDFSI